jgi:hypothetical protein
MEEAQITKRQLGASFIKKAFFGPNITLTLSSLEVSFYSAKMMCWGKEGLCHILHGQANSTYS